MVSCPTYQSYTSRKREARLEGVTMADSDSVSELPAYLVPACLLGTLAVIGSLALCLARDTVQATIATIGTVVLGRGVAGVQTGRQGEPGQGGGEAATEMLRTDIQTDWLEHADTVRTNMLVVNGSKTDKIEIEASHNDRKNEADMLICGEIGKIS